MKRKRTVCLIEKIIEHTLLDIAEGYALMFKGKLNAEQMRNEAILINENYVELMKLESVLRYYRLKEKIIKWWRKK